MVDGNNPLCGRKVIFVLKVITVRNPTDECVDSLMKCQADFSLSKSTKNLKPKEDK